MMIIIILTKKVKMMIKNKTKKIMKMMMNTIMKIKKKMKIYIKKSLGMAQNINKSKNICKSSKKNKIMRRKQEKEVKNFYRIFI